jgi:hypothetical protein
MVLLPLTGVITPTEAISGLSSNAVVSIIAVIIMGHGLDKKRMYLTGNEPVLYNMAVFPNG